MNPPTTLTGDDAVVVLLFPNLPHAFDPHAHAEPLLLTAVLCTYPLLTAHQSENPPTTLTGDDLGAVVLSPNEPKLLTPHPHAVPLDLTAIEIALPPLIEHQSVKPPTTLTGDELFERLFCPN